MLKVRPAFFLCLLLTALPFLCCFLSGRTLAPLNAFHYTNLPYAADKTYPVPSNHFWVDTANFYWPRLHQLNRGEFPIAYDSGGTPNYADTISGFFSPFSVFVFYLLPAGKFSLDLFWLLQFLVYGSGFFLWLILAGASPLGALIGSLTQTYCTAFFPGSYMSFQTLGALTFLPWSLWADMRLKNSRHRFWVPALFLGLCIFAGNIQTVLFPLIVFGLWGLVQKRILPTIYSGCLAILFTLPFWLVGFEYHVLLNIQNLANRHSQVPQDILGKLKVLLAMPGFFLPDILGSSKSIDFLKAFQTSTTYFIGGIGIIAPICWIISFKRSDLQKKEVRFSLLLIVFSFLVMVTPLLNFLYYRVLCLTGFGFSALVALNFENFFESKKSKALLGLSGFLLLIATTSFMVKRHFHDAINVFMSKQLSAGMYSWSAEITAQRIDHWFQNYLTSPHFLALILLSAGAYFAAKAKKKFILGTIIFADVFLIWLGQVTFDKAEVPSHPAYTVIKNELEKSSSYPLSRFLPLECHHNNGFLFPFILHEYQGVPGIQFYGSTNVERLPLPSYNCDEASHRVILQNEAELQQSALNVIVTNSGWELKGEGFKKILENPQYTIWSRPSYAAIWDEDPLSKSAKIQVSTEKWNGSKISFSVDAPQAISSWSLSLPHYPGWVYKLDQKRILPSKITHAVPTFEAPLSAGHHTVVAIFQPLMLYWGLLGTFLSLLIALWKSTSTRA